MRPVICEIAVIHLGVVPTISERVVLRIPIPSVGGDDHRRGRRGKAIRDHLVGVMVGDLRARSVGRQNNGARITHVPARSSTRRTSGPRRVVELHHVNGARFIDPRPHAKVRNGDRGGSPVIDFDAEILILVALGMALDEEVKHRRRNPRLSPAKRPRGKSRCRRAGSGGRGRGNRSGTRRGSDRAGGGTGIKLLTE
jgi:hypothetical protein